MLELGRLVAMKAEDAKESYGASVEAAADEAAHGTVARIALKSGSVTTSHSLGSAGGRTSGGSEAPATTYGAVTLEVDGVDAKDDERPGVPLMGVPVVPASVSMPVGSDGSSTRKPTVVWEYEVHDGYTAFHDDCQKYMEQRYQNFVGSGGNARINVKTQGKQVSVDFERMSNKVGDSHKIRKIRRTERDKE